MNLAQNTSNNQPAEGKTLDPDKLTKEESKKLLSAEFISIEKYPEIVNFFPEINKGINEFTKKFNAPKINFKPSDIRLIDKKIWRDTTKIACSREDCGAFWDPQSKKCYLRFDKEEYEGSRIERIFELYIICHELGHKAFPGLEKYSPAINEGLTDSAALMTMESHILPKIYTPEEYAERKKYIEQMSPEDSSGFRIKEEELFAAIEEKILYVARCTRIPEMRLVEKMSSAHPDEFNKIIGAYLKDDAAGSEDLMEKTYGKEIAGKLAENNFDIKEIIGMIE